MKQKFKTREQWLEAAGKLMAEKLFKQHGHKVPPFQVSIGFPSHRGGLKVLGTHWSPESSSNKTSQIFLTPTHADSITVQATLVHELVHAIVGNKQGHNKVFGKLARAVGLEGKLTATYAGPELTKQLEEFARRLGPLPHGRLNPQMNPKKKQGTRLLKAFCPITKYTVRITKTWVEVEGPPECPCHHTPMTVEMP